MHDHLPKAKWYFKVDDDTFVFPANYLQSLQKLNSEAPAYIGMTLHFPDQAINSGGAGWTISRFALQKLYPHLNTCRDMFMHHGEEMEGEDVVIWECLKKWVPNIAITDNKGQYHSEPEAVLGVYRGRNPGGLVTRPISFHYMSWNRMFAMEWLMWYTKI